MQAIFAPADESVTAIKRWLVDAGISAETISSPKSQGWIDFRTTVSKLEALLQTRYHIYESRASGTESVGTDEYHLPTTIAEHIDFITPAVAHLQVQRRDGTATAKARSASLVAKKRPLAGSSQHNAASACDQVVTPACIRGVYSIPQGTSNIRGNELGMFEADIDIYKQNDLDLFYRKFATNIPKGFGPTVHYIDYNGDIPDGSEATCESALDFDIALPIIYPQRSILYQTNNNLNVESTTTGIFNQFLDAVDGTYCTKDGGDDPKVDGKIPHQPCGEFKPANVISFSYGMSENDWPTAYQKRQCNEFMKLGLQGTSVVFASGDGGVAGRNGEHCNGLDGSIFNPTTPASCPYVTSVGSTQLTGSDIARSPESATTSFSSGGGFSNIWTTPSYQSHAVSSYFAQHDPGFPSFNISDNKIPANGGIYNRQGRGYPDVAALGSSGVSALGGAFTLMDGTSMSCPLFASILNRINEERLKIGKPVVGFVNPALYRNPSMFRDVTIGGHFGVGTCKGKGFSAVEGWDPVTGLGTPRYPEMIKYFTSL